MKTLFFLICFALATTTEAQNWSQTDEQLLKRASARVGVEIKSPEYFRTAPAEVAWEAFREIDKWTGYGNLELAKQAGRAIAENAAVEKYVTEGMASLPHDFFNDGDRRGFLIPLGDVPAPWSLRLLGHYLMDERPMNEKGAPDDYGASPNPVLATLALSRMNFSDGPSKGRDGQIQAYPGAYLEWPAWWKANENRVDERIREINPGYYVPKVVVQTRATPSPTPTPIAIVATPTSKPIQQPPPSPTPAIIASKPEPTPNDWMLYVGAGITLLIAGAIVIGFLLRRKP